MPSPTPPPPYQVSESSSGTIQPEGPISTSQTAAGSRTPLGMRSMNATAGPSRLSRTHSNHPTSSLSTRLAKDKKGLHRQFVPPARIRPLGNMADSLSMEGRPAEQPQKLDVKPIGKHSDLQPGLPIKRRRSSSPVDVKPLIPGSRHAPILVEDDVIVHDVNGRPAAPVLPPPTGAPVIVQNVTYNVVHVHNHIVYQGNEGQPIDEDQQNHHNIAHVPRPLLERHIPMRVPAPAPPTIIAPAQRPIDQRPIDPDFVPHPDIPAANAEEGPALSRAQQQILNAVLEGHSVLIHGSAGTGKSVLIRAIKKAFAERYEAAYLAAPPSSPPPSLNGIGRTYDDRLLYPMPEIKWKLRVTASTGLAAVNVGGTTFHSFIGAGLCKGKDADLVEMIQRTDAADEWTSTAAVVIDEISMVDGQFFDRVDRIGRKVRDKDRPFGGLQIIACGDFLQLAPVGEDINDTGIKTATYAFDSAVWPQLFAHRHHFNLEHNYRQGDVSFRQLLERMRRGYLGQEDHRVLRTLGREPQYQDALEPVFLMPRRKEVDILNQARLSRCPGPNRTYMAYDVPGETATGERLTLDAAKKKLNEETRFPEKLDLRIGAQVMLVMNMKESFLVNGTTGQVIDFMTRDEARIAGIPEPSLAAFFDPPRDVLYPVVKFAKMRYCPEPPPPALLISTMEIDISTSRKKVIASREQVPMILAWALTIHKAQGQTLDRIKVDVKMCRYAGQAYTAISRVTSKEGLQLLNFTPKCVQVDQVAERWVRELEGDDDFMSYVERNEE